MVGYLVRVRVRARAGAGVKVRVRVRVWVRVWVRVRVRVGVSGGLVTSTKSDPSTERHAVVMCTAFRAFCPRRGSHV